MRLNTFIVVIGLILIALNLVNASFIVGNPSHEIKTNYNSGDALAGWINISLTNQPGSSKLTAFNSKITILDFLDKNDIDCSTSTRCGCQPADCEIGYTSEGSGITTKSITLASWEEKLIGVKLTGEISAITKFSFTINSNIGESCISQLKVTLPDSEWNAGTIKEDSECPSNLPYGCFNEADSTEITPLEKFYRYCQKINLKGKGFKVGAQVNGTGNAEFKMNINTEDCEVSITEEGEFSCTVEFDNEIDEEADVCLDVTQSTNYSIPYETTSPCGYTGEYEYDFKIFAKPLKYSAIGTININNTLLSNLEDEIEDYVFNKYNGNCSNTCFIPIRLQGIAQGITLSDLKVTYTSGGLTKQENDFFDLTEQDPIITSNYLKLELEDANLKVPSNKGAKKLILELGNSKVLEKNIQVAEGVEIKDIIPKEVPSLVPVTFIILTEGNASAEYKWDFGDQSSTITTGNKVTHTYEEIGTYELKVTLNGQSKTISVKVKSPKESVNKTITDYKNNLNKLKEEIEKLSAWIQDNLKQEIELDELTAKVDEQEARTSDGIDEQEAIDIMKKLLALKIPTRLGTGIIINKVDFIQDSEVLDLTVLKEMGAGDFEKGREGYISAINNWKNTNLDMRMESKTYTAYFDQGGEDLISHVKIYLDPKTDLGNLYFLVDKEVEFIGEGLLSNKVIEDVTGSQVIEFLYPGRVTINNIPVYVSPKETELELGIDIDTCDNNGICEDGEKYKNCPNDCKRWFSSTIMLIGLFVLALIIYIFLQEWYKRYYQKHLFPNRNQLFNLVHFMNNSLNQGMKKSTIIEKLEDTGWKSEQLTYAWRKLHGKRTGMWEIPLFKWVENRQVKRELAKRGGGKVILPREGAGIIGHNQLRTNPQAGLMRPRFSGFGSRDSKGNPPQDIDKKFRREI